MAHDRLNGLASLYTYKDIDGPIKEVINKFAITSRRISMASILDSDHRVEEHDGSLISDVY